MSDVVAMETLGLPIDTAVCFSTAQNKFSKRVMKRQMKILRPLVPLLRQFLEPDEAILLATRACSPLSTLEKFGSGLMHYTKRCALVVTNKRLLHIPTRLNYHPKKSIAQVLYGDIAAAKPRAVLSRALALTYKSGQQETFSNLARGEFKKLKALLAARQTDSPISEARQRHHLCPKCMTPLRQKTYACSVCRLEFKTPQQALRRSLLIPGGGWFYAGHPMLGTLYALVEVALLVEIILIMTGIPSGLEADAWAPVIYVLFVFALEKLLAIHHVKRAMDEYIPSEEFVPIKTFAR